LELGVACETIAPLERRSAFSEAGKKLVAERSYAEKFIADSEDFFEQSVTESEKQGELLLIEN